MPNITDPKVKDTRKVRMGSVATLVRNKKGDIEKVKDKDYAGINEQTIKEDYDYKRRLQEGDMTFDGVAAPRQGGKVDKAVSAKGTSGKKLIIRSIKNAKRSDASPAAKKASIKILRRKQ